MECQEDNCTGSARKKGYCNRHYSQHRLKGEVGWNGTTCVEDECTLPAITKHRCHYHYGVFHRAEIARGVCSIDKCDRPLFSGGWCQRHYTANLRWGDPLVNKKLRQICIYEGCDRKQAARQYCDKHYRRLKKWGTPENPLPPIYLDPPPLVCLQCGNDIEMVGQGKQRTYCTDLCRDAANFWNKREQASRTRLRLFNLTAQQYEKMLSDQDGRCAICPATEPKGRGTWHIDHDHACCPGKGSCGKCVRGLLCSRCNLVLGAVEDSADCLRAAAAYLERSKSVGITGSSFR